MTLKQLTKLFATISVRLARDRALEVQVKAMIATRMSAEGVTRFQADDGRHYKMLPPSEYPKGNKRLFAEAMSIEGLPQAQQDRIMHRACTLVRRSAVLQVSRPDADLPPELRRPHEMPQLDEVETAALAAIEAMHGEVSSPQL